jgi:hypothetical protein
MCLLHLIRYSGHQYCMSIANDLEHAHIQPHVLEAVRVSVDGL